MHGFTPDATMWDLHAGALTMPPAELEYGVILQNRRFLWLHKNA